VEPALNHFEEFVGVGYSGDAADTFEFFFLLRFGPYPNQAFADDESDAFNVTLTYAFDDKLTFLEGTVETCRYIAAEADFIPALSPAACAAAGGQSAEVVAFGSDTLTFFNVVVEDVELAEPDTVFHVSFRAAVENSVVPRERLANTATWEYFSTPFLQPVPGKRLVGGPVEVEAFVDGVVVTLVAVVSSDAATLGTDLTPDEEAIVGVQAQFPEGTTGASVSIVIPSNFEVLNASVFEVGGQVQGSLLAPGAPLVISGGGAGATTVSGAHGTLFNQPDGFNTTDDVISVSALVR
jgi:hypothetical protein